MCHTQPNPPAPIVCTYTSRKRHALARNVGFGGVLLLRETVENLVILSGELAL